MATGNPNKVVEISTALGSAIELLGLKDIGCLEEIPETSPTIAGNATQKSFYVYHNYNYDCFADDTGLEVEALDGSPGVYSARYAGPDCKASDNIAKLLSELEGESNRNARFKTVISLIINGEEVQFEGVVDGRITEKPSGAGGFGYDPVFVPEGYDITFAEMSLEEKNTISHRGLAVAKLKEYLTSL